MHAGRIGFVEVFVDDGGFEEDALIGFEDGDFAKRGNF